MNTNDLKLFEAVAYYGSFTKAAEAMFTVQSNVTARIKNLEQEFDTELFIRSNRKVELTAAGETLMLYSKKISRLIDEAKSSIVKNDTVQGQIKIGSLETMMIIKGPELINHLAVEYPSVDLFLQSGMREKLVNDVITHKLDAAFVPAPVHIPELEQLKIKDEQIVIVAPADCKSLEDVLLNNPLKTIVFDQGCVFRAKLEAWLLSRGIFQFHSTVMNSVEGVINFVESGIGISVLPMDIISKFYSSRSIKTFALPPELGLVTTVLIYRKDLSPAPALDAFITLCKNDTF
ncbi:LysR family transcriptional regulator [Flavobacterium sp. HJSW_4]|uniref:LysR family transcriptional regulator n=1 Tax=Flavobacterium sp. HJSW_4 TaxID=3344660 RepID=UPI0035F35B1B